MNCPIITAATGGTAAIITLILLPSAEDLAISEVFGVSGFDELVDGTAGGGVCAGTGCVAGVAATGVAAALADD
jgi:hypothetical protein